MELLLDSVLLPPRLSASDVEFPSTSLWTFSVKCLPVSSSFPTEVSFLDSVPFCLGSTSPDFSTERITVEIGDGNGLVVKVDYGGDYHLWIF